MFKKLIAPVALAAAVMLVGCGEEAANTETPVSEAEKLTATEISPYPASAMAVNNKINEALQGVISASDDAETVAALDKLVPVLKEVETLAPGQDYAAVHDTFLSGTKRLIEYADMYKAASKPLDDATKEQLMQLYRDGTDLINHAVIGM